MYEYIINMYNYRESKIGDLVIKVKAITYMYVHVHENSL